MLKQEGGDAYVIVDEGFVTADEDSTAEVQPPSGPLIGVASNMTARDYDIYVLEARLALALIGDKDGCVDYDELVRC